MSKAILRRLLVVGAAVFVGMFVQALPAFGADTLTPSVFSTTLQAGASTTVNKTLHLDGLPPRADIIVAVDTTGSMAGPIAQAQADANNICSTVQGAIPGARFAVVDFEDYPPPLGPGQAGDIACRLLTPTGFTSSCATFSAAIATMSAVNGSGGDDAEAYNRVYYEAYHDAGNPTVTSRDPLATQFLVVLGDAAPHSASAFNSCPAAPPNDLGRDGVPGTPDDLDTTTAINGLIANNIHLAMIRYTTGGVSVSLSCYQDMANATGGTAVNDSGAGTIGPFIIANAQAVPYTVNLQVAPAGLPDRVQLQPAVSAGAVHGTADASLRRDDHRANRARDLHVHADGGAHTRRTDAGARDRDPHRHTREPCVADARAEDRHQRRRRHALRDGDGQGHVRQSDAGDSRALYRHGVGEHGR
jgi:hypothetical protein